MYGAGAIVTYVGALAFNETLKKTEWFHSLTKTMASGMNGIVGVTSNDAEKKLRSALGGHTKFVAENEQRVRRLAGNRKELSFLHQALDWIKEITNNPK